jgi:putative alpha-1,2-mannosidase
LSLVAAVRMAAATFDDVDPFIGTGKEGNCHPGAQAPLGMISSSPNTTSTDQRRALDVGVEPLHALLAETRTTLIVTLGPKPAPAWTTAPEDRPPSFDRVGFTPASRGKTSSPANEPAASSPSRG